MKTSAEIRSAFLKFFASKGHEVVASSPLVPGNDPTLMFTNSGMVQFKDMFLGAEKRSYTRAATAQRCVRAGGKHNDLENVGYTARHHTFFEMLGNFSFGDYFKRDAIHYAWELLTSVYGLPKEKLWVTVYHTDDEAFGIWEKEVGVPAERIVRIGDNKGAPFASDNFWQMADTGPCGPCSEIFYDHGDDVFGGPPGSADQDGDRYIEIWNLVFMQFDRSADGTLTPLPKPCVDTGMGLERLTAVLQHVHSNYQIDSMQALVKAAASVTNRTDFDNPSLNVIADHIRACSFMIVDGVLPSNEGRGYVLRRIIRRALRHGHKLGCKGLFFHKLVRTLDELMGEAYPELRQKRAQVEQVLKLEEEKFSETLDKGMKVFEELVRPERLALDAYMEELGAKKFSIGRFGVGDSQAEVEFAMDRVLTSHFQSSEGVEYVAEAVNALDGFDAMNELARDAMDATFHYEARRTVIVVCKEEDREKFEELLGRKLDDFPVNSMVRVIGESGIPKVIAGKNAFSLYDTYGFPVDLTADVARERGLTVDMAGFEQAMQQQKERGRAASQFEAQHVVTAETVKGLPATEFLGYGAVDAQGCKVVGLIRSGKMIDQVNDGESALVVLDRTPFYAESGGQVGDTGSLESALGTFRVDDTIKLAGTFFAHVGVWSGRTLTVGAVLDASVDAARRQQIILNHSATHLMHAALRKVLGEHVQQKGSLVAPDRLRFDFSHFQPVSDAELRQIERLVNAEIRANAEAEVHHMGMQEALDFGAMALFGEKYGERVRVLKMGDFSTELCGGTHVSRTGDIGLFKIVTEGGVASGVRRIEAFTGAGAEALIEHEEDQLAEVAALLSSSTDEVTSKLKKLFDKQKELERELESLKAKAAGAAIAELAEKPTEIAGIKVIAARLDGLDSKGLREAVDQLKNKLTDCAVVLASGAEGKITLIAGASGAALGKLKAGELIAHVAGQINGKGGGRPEMAQGGGEDGPNVAPALASVAAFAQSKLG